MPFTYTEINEKTKAAKDMTGFVITQGGNVIVLEHYVDVIKLCNAASHYLEDEQIKSWMEGI